MFRCDIKNAYFRGKDQTVVIRDVVAGRAKTVPVQRRAKHFSVGEKDCCGSVPGFHHRCIVVIEVLLVLAHEGVVLPWLRDDHHHGQRQRHAVHIEEFQCIVEHGGIRSASIHDRENLIDIVLHDRACHRLFSGQHPVNIAADGVDLTIVGDHSIWMRAMPGRRRVGGESGVYDCDRRLVILILQIFVKSSQLANQEHALVDDRPGGKRADISVLARLLELSSHNVESAVKIDPLLHAFRPLYETLPDAGHAVDGCFTEDLFMHGHFAPPKNFHAFLLRDHLEHSLCKRPFQRILRQEEHSDAVVACLRVRQLADPGLICCFPGFLLDFLYALRLGFLYALRLDFLYGFPCEEFCKKLVGDLRQDPDAVSHFSGGVLACPVLQFFHNMKRVIQDLMILSAVNVYNASDAAGIMLLLVPHSFSSHLSENSIFS